MTDLSSIPLSQNDASPSWNALVDALTSHGILKGSSAAAATGAGPCATVADLMGRDEDVNLPPLVLLLVGGSWCAPCRNFTPVLMKCTADLKKEENVKVVFCSADHDEASFQKYYQKMPNEWSAVPYDEDGEDERDDLLEALNANTLPTLLVFDPVAGVLLEQNAVHAVQAGGSGDNFMSLLEKWRGMIAAGESAGAHSAIADEEKKESDPGDSQSNTLHFFVPAPLALICQYFKEQLLSPHLPEALTSVILRREVLPAEGDNIDNNAMALADSMMVGNASDLTERWLFRTGAPALPLSWYGSSILGAFVDASALECWVIERGDGAILKATCLIENETARSLVVFRETIVMEDNGSGGCNVTKTLDLSGVPSLGHGAFQRRWKNESEVIFHALLGTCNRKSKCDK
jgi:thiol-disulfide isomerase/thioredoxin